MRNTWLSDLKVALIINTGLSTWCGQHLLMQPFTQPLSKALFQLHNKVCWGASRIFCISTCLNGLMLWSQMLGQIKRNPGSGRYKGQPSNYLQNTLTHGKEIKRMHMLEFCVSMLATLIILRAWCAFNVPCYSYVLQLFNSIVFFFFSLPRGLCNKLREPTVAERTFEPQRKQNVLNF